MLFSDGLYHRSIFLPNEILERVPTSLRNIEWSRHALEKAGRDCIPLTDAYDNLMLIEADIYRDEVYKAVYRRGLYSWADMVFAIKFIPHPLATTVWLTQKFDWHYTLDTSKYVQG